MKKLILFFIGLILFAFACSKESDSNEDDDFFKNHSDKVWIEMTDNEIDRLVKNVIFSNNTFYNGHISLINKEYVVGKWICDKLFIGEMKNHSNESIDFLFGESQVNINNTIIVNKSNELQIEYMMTSLDGSIIKSEKDTFKVNGDILTATFSENYLNLPAEEVKFSIHNGNLDFNFNDCRTVNW